MTLTLLSIASVPAPGPKLCRDCKWVERGWFGRVAPNAKCLHRAATPSGKTQSVTGHADPGEQFFAEGMRVSTRDNRCGPEAKLWEKR